MKRIARIGIAAVIGALQLAYDVQRRVFGTRHQVTLMSRLFSTSSHDFLALREALLREDPSVKVVVLNHRTTALWRVPFNVLSEIHHLARSECVVLDSYIMPVSALRHAHGLQVIQMWHALGAVKRFGLAAVGAQEGRAPWVAEALHMHEGYDVVIAGGARMVAPFSEAFGVDPDQVLPIGTPRVDMLRDPAWMAATSERIRAAHPALGSKPVVLYAPTFRMHSEVDVDSLLAELDTEAYDVVVALHPLDDRSFEGKEGVVQDRTLSTLDWLSVADAVVTDYSAILFDAAVLGVPLYFYAYDLEAYTAERGLFLDYEADMPGPVLRTAAEVALAIEEGTGSGDQVAAFRRDFVATGSGPVATQLARLALRGVEPRQSERTV